MSGGKYALLIGASQFGDGGPQALTASETDVSALRQALLDPMIGGFEAANVKNAMNSGGDETQSLIMWLCENRHPDDLLLLYYTGHGLCDQRTNDLYLALQGTTVARPQIASLSAGWVKREIGLSRSTRKLVILDCCHSGLFGAAGAVTKRGETKLVTPETFNPQGAGSWTLASSTSDQVSLVDLETHRSVFTETLVEALTTGSAAPDREELSVTELANYLQEEVPERAKALGGYMQPELLGSQRSPLIIARNPQPRKPVPQDLILALSSEDELLRRGSIAKLAVFAADPASLWHEEARALLEKRLLPDGESHFELRGQIETALASPAAGFLQPPPDGPRTPDGDPPPKSPLRLVLLACAASAALTWGALEIFRPAPPGDDRVRDLQLQLKDLQQERDRVMNASVEYEARIAELQSERNALSVASEGADAFEARIEKLEAELAASQGDRKSQDAELATLRQQLSQTNAGRETTVADLEKRITERETRIDSLSKKNAALETELTAIRSSLEDTRAAHDRVARADDAKTEEIRALTKRVADLEGSLARSESDLAVEREALAETRHTLAQARARLQPAVEKNKALEQQLAALQAPPTRREKYADLSSFRDDLGNDVKGPEMVVIPAGRFMMGSPEGEWGRDDDEGPQRAVTVGRFALGRREVTFSDWQVCVGGGGCKSNPSPDDRGWGRGSRPVINVSWDDAQEYIAWLNGKVDGAPYRLPTEAEWEYAARAGTVTPFWTGETISTDQANYNGNHVYGNGREGIYRGKTLPVGILNTPNPFGLHDVHGNVWEWAQDCHTSYSNAPVDGTAYSPLGCSQRVLRGGSWFNYPRLLRSASRDWSGPADRYDLVGFRLARTLTP